MRAQSRRAGPQPARRELPQPDGGDYRLVNTPEELRRASSQELARQPEFALDTETTGVEPDRRELVGISFAWELGRAYYVPVRSSLYGALPLDLVRERLARSWPIRRAARSARTSSTT